MISQKPVVAKDGTGQLEAKSIVERLMEKLSDATTSHRPTSEQFTLGLL